MSVDVKKMTLKITTDSSGQVCVTNPILLLSSSDIEEKRILLSRSLMVDFILFSLFIFIFTFHFFFFFIFLFLEQLGLGFISHAVTSVTN